MGGTFMFKWRNMHFTGKLRNGHLIVLMVDPEMINFILTQSRSTSSNAESLVCTLNMIQT